MWTRRLSRCAISYQFASRAKLRPLNTHDIRYSSKSTSSPSEVARVGSQKITEEEIIPSKTLFDNVFLRDACSCSSCVDPSTKQKTFSTAQLPTDTYIKSRKSIPGKVSDPEDRIEIVWGAKDEADHVSEYKVKQLEMYGSPLLRYNNRWKFAREQIHWNQKFLEKHLVTREYEDYMKNEEAFNDVLLGLYSTGLAMVRGAPAAEKDTDGQILVEKIAKKIGYIKETFYGTSWDVRAIANARNIAYVV